MESYPRAIVRWFHNGRELLPSKEFGLDHYEDGTSILTMSEVFPDDGGELMCEAQNDKGVTTCVVQLNVVGGQSCLFIHYGHIINWSNFYFGIKAVDLNKNMNDGYDVNSYFDMKINSFDHR